MFTPSNKIKVWLSSKPTDMRKAIDGLCFLVVEVMKLEPTSGELFIFYNKNFDKLKVLYWDHNGFCLWYKRLEKNRFKLPKDVSAPLMITIQQLKWILEGLDFTKIQMEPKLNYNTFF